MCLPDSFGGGSFTGSAFNAIGILHSWINGGLFFNLHNLCLIYIHSFSIIARNDFDKYGNNSLTGFKSYWRRWGQCVLSNELTAVKCFALHSIEKANSYLNKPAQLIYKWFCECDKTWKALSFVDLIFSVLAYWSSDYHLSSDTTQTYLHIIGTMNKCKYVKQFRMEFKWIGLILWHIFKRKLEPSVI